MNSEIVEAASMKLKMLLVSSVVLLALFAYWGREPSQREAGTSPLVSEQQAIEIAQRRVHHTFLRAHFLPSADIGLGAEMKQRSVWALFAGPSGEPTSVLYLDAVTGEPLQETLISIVRTPARSAIPIAFRLHKDLR
jgi:hypothetical protein